MRGVRAALRRLLGRPPVVVERRQLTQAECGAACLAMVLSTLGRRTSTAQCREHLMVGRDGADALAIVQTARTYGLRPQALSAEPSHLAELAMPAIAHVDFRHFVVVERWSKRGVHVVDPATGRHRLDHEEFDRRFTGVLICFETTEDFEPGDGQRPHVWRDYLANAFRSRHTITTFGQILVASLLVAALGLIGPALTMVIVDEVLPQGATDAMAILGLGIAVMAATYLVVSLLRGLLVVYLQARLDARLMLPFFRHVLSLPYRFFQDRSSGDLLMRLMSNANIRELLSSQTVQIVIDAVLVLTYAAILVYIAPGFGLLVIALGVSQLIVLASTMTWMHNLMRRELQAQADSQSYLVEALHGIAPIKASGSEEQALERWSGLFGRTLQATVARGKLSAVISSLLRTVNTMGPVITLAVGALYVLDGRLTLGTMLAINALAVSFLAPLSTLTAAGQQLQLLGATLERLADVAGAEPEPRRQGVIPPGADGHESTDIEVDNVTFRYGGDGPPILDNVSLRVPRGQKVAIVGPTGSGKSTLAKILLGLYEPQDGIIRYNGVPAHEVDVVALRRRFGVVLQESSLFSGSLRSNIAFNDPKMPMSSVERAARLAALDQDVERMPMGYETLVSEGGSAMSGGQRQRIALARALATEPSLLVLDEATSHLDVVTEGVVDSNISALDCTQVAIAHRLSTIRDADRIVVMAEGRVVEQGTHEKLLAAGGHYAALVGQQLAGAARQDPSGTGD